MDKVRSVEQLLDQEPLSPEIREWIKSNPVIYRALKVIMRERFVPLHAISIVDEPDLNNVKQSVGIYSVDKKQGCKLKQDYIMHHNDGTLMLFTGLPQEGEIGDSSYIQHVDTLEQRYGPDGKNFWINHHQPLETLNPDIRPYLEAAIKKCKQHSN